MSIPVILTVLIGIGISSCTGNSSKKNEHTGVEYYRSLQFSETPYDIEKGTHPLTADRPPQLIIISSHMIIQDDFFQWNSDEIMSFLIIHQWEMLQK